MFARATIYSGKSVSAQFLSRPVPRICSTRLIQGRQFRKMASSNSLPSKISGVIIEKTGGKEVLQYKTDLPLPELKDGEVLVKNEFIGINYIDT
jgi:hypothetical protein